MNSLSPSAFWLIIPTVIAGMDQLVSITVRDATNGAVTPIELPCLATVQDLHAALVEMHAINTSEYKITISYHGEELNDFGAMLADTGIAMQSVVDFNVIQFIVLSSEAATFQDCVNMDDQKTIRWDPTKDLTQFSWVNSDDRVDEIAIMFEEQRSNSEWTAFHHTHDSQTADSHSFWIVRTKDVAAHTTVINLRDVEGKDIYPLSLRVSTLAQDVVCTPNATQAMWLVLGGRLPQRGHAVYRFPGGYSLLLKHRKGEYDAAIALQSDEATANQIENYPLIDTRNDLASYWRKLAAMRDAAVSLRDERGSAIDKIRVFYHQYPIPPGTKASHLFFLKPISYISELVRFIPETDVVNSSDLHGEQYAKDMALIPEQGEALYLQFWNKHGVLEQYRIPDGFGLWLQHTNRRSIRLYRSEYSQCGETEILFNLDHDFAANPSTSNDNLCHVAVELFDRVNGKRKTYIDYMYPAHGKSSAHLFFIKPIEQLSGSQFWPSQQVSLLCLSNELYANDMVLIPNNNETLILGLTKKGDKHTAMYDLPAGYGLWLKHTYRPHSIPLQLLPSPDGRTVDAPSPKWLELRQCLKRFARTERTRFVAVWLADSMRFQDGNQSKLATVFLRAHRYAEATSHVFLVQDNTEITQQFGNGMTNLFQHADTLFPYDLRQAEYARDLVITPNYNQIMGLSLYDHPSTQVQYAFPAGYSIVLKYNWRDQ